MKRLLVLLLSCLMMIVCLAACSGNKTPGETGENSSGGGEPFVPPSGNHNTPSDNPGMDDEEPFLVTLITAGKVYIPTTTIYAQWKSTADGSVQTAKFDKKGRAYGPSNLDGEYDVTLSAVPYGYAYDPNIYHVSNQEKTAEIELFNCFSVSSPSGEPNPNVAMTLTVGRIYRATLKSADDRVWFNLPMCQLETFCDTVADDVNPTIKGYTAFGVGGLYDIDSEKVIQGGGVNGIYTHNVKFDKKGEYAPFTFFSVSAESQSQTYPVTVDFKLTAIDDEGGGTTAPDASHNPDLMQVLDVPGTFIYNYQDTNRQLLGSRFKLFELNTQDAAGNRGDGYYHLYDRTTNTYGAIVFAVLTKNCDLLDKPIVDIVNSDSPIKQYYAKYANKDGAHPVTEELRVVLNNFAGREQYFYDGFGYMEMMKGMRSLIEDQWLFCCGYYVEFEGKTITV